MSDVSTYFYDPATIAESISAVVYATDFPTSFDFYSRCLGLKVFGDVDSSTRACFFYIGDNPNALYLEGGYNPNNAGPTSTRISVMLHVSSAIAVHNRLKQIESIRLVHDHPMKLGENAYWFQVYDPSGNIVEIAGGL